MIVVAVVVQLRHFVHDIVVLHWRRRVRPWMELIKRRHASLLRPLDLSRDLQKLGLHLLSVSIASWLQ
jgi:hypothetical protein